MAEIEALFERYKSGSITYEEYHDEVAEIIGSIIRKGDI